MQSLAALVVFVATLCTASASLLAPEQCVILSDIPNELVKCSGTHPVSACAGPSGCTSITDSKDCMSAVCCCSRAPELKQAKTNRRMAQEMPMGDQPMPMPMPMGPAMGPMPEPIMPVPMGPAMGPMPDDMPMPMPMPAVKSAPCIANITYGTSWTEDGGYLNSINVVLTNEGPETISIPYTVVISKAGWSEVIQSWNWEAEVMKTNFVTGNFTYGSWQDLQGMGMSSSYFGMIVKSTEDAFDPPADLTLNGVNCKIA